MYTLLLVLIYLAFISLGLPDSLLGSGWPVMHGDLQVPVSYMGIVTMIISAGTVVSSLCSYRLTKKLGTPVVTVGSVFLTAAALLGFSFANQFWMLLVLAVALRPGGRGYRRRAEQLCGPALHLPAHELAPLFLGGGDHCEPLCDELVPDHGLVAHGVPHHRAHPAGHRRAAAAHPGGVEGEPAQGGHQCPGQGAHFRPEDPGGAGAAVGIPLLLRGGGHHHELGQHLPGGVPGIDPERAAQFASLFFIGITAGRFLGGFLMNKLGDWKMIVLGTVILACGVAALVLPVPGEVLPLAGLVTIGLGCAPIYPCIIHATPANFGPENSAAIIGIQMASAYVGSTFGPPLFGLLGNHVSFGLFPLYVAAFAALMVCMTGTAFRLARGDKGGEK